MLETRREENSNFLSMKLPFDLPTLKQSSMRTSYQNTQIDPRGLVPANRGQEHYPPHLRQTTL